MLPLSKTLRVAGRDIATIVGPIEVIHEEQEPILFTGVNRFGTQIIGNFVDEDIKGRTRRYLHIQVPKGDYKDFIAGRLSYGEIVKRAGSVYIVDRSAGPSAHQVLMADDYSQIPVEYLPDGNSLAPPLAIQGGAEYIHTLGGGRARLSGADPAKVAKLLSSFPPVLTDPANDVTPEHVVRADVLAFPEGSFEVAFALRHEADATLPLFGPAIDYAPYVQRFVDFCMNRFASEAPFIAEHDLKHAPYFLELIEARREAQTRAAFPANAGNPAYVAQLAARGVEAMETLAGLLDEDLTSISLHNMADGVRSHVGIINQQSQREFAVALDVINPFIAHGTSQLPAREYIITMHALNKESHLGGARILMSNSKGRGQKTRVSIASDIDLEPFTESMHLGTFLGVKAVARVNDQKRVVYLDILSTV